MRRFNAFIIVLGLVVFTSVFVISIQQFRHNRTSISVKGFELVNGNKYDVSGYLSLSDDVFVNKPNPNHNQAYYSTIEMPYIGTFYQENDKWVFKLSENIYNKNDKKDLNIIFPRCKYEDEYIAPNREFKEQELFEHRLEIEDPVRGGIFYVSLQKKDGKVYANTKSLIDVALNLRKNGEKDTILLTNNKDLVLKYNYPNNILQLSNLYQNTQENIVEIEKKSWRSSIVKITGRKSKINLSNNFFTWNGWLIELSGYVDYGIVFATFFTIFLGFLFFILMIGKLGRLSNKYENILEIHSIRIFIVFLLLTIISLIFINYISINFYERNYLLLYTFIYFGWFIYLFLTLYKRKIDNSFLKKISQSKRKYIVIILLILVSLIIAKLLNKGERIGFGNYGIPIVHYVKFVIILFIIIPLKDQIFGNKKRNRNIAHLILWLSIVALSIITKDFGSLLITFIAYVIVSVIYTKKIIFTRILKQLSILGLTMVLLIIGVSYFGIHNQSLDNYLAKLYRFTLPYFDLESSIFNYLPNGHKESYAKIIWGLDDVFNKNIFGLYNDYSSVNFYTTFHTDMGFLSILQFGGVFLGTIVVLLVFYLLYNFISYLLILGKLINKNTANNEEVESIEIKNFIRSNLYIYFIVTYLLVQTIYPILSNLNILPLTGQAIPGLTVSIIEYFFTPLFVGLMYYYSKRILNKKFAIQDGEKFSFKDSIRENKPIFTRRSEYAKWVSLLFFFGVSIVFFVKFKYFDGTAQNKEQLTLNYIRWENENVNDVINTTNKELLPTNSEKEAKKILIKNSAEKFHQLDVSNKKILISRLKNYYFRGISDKYQEKVPRIGLIESSDSISPNKSERHIAFHYINENAVRKVSKKQVLNNFSFANKFNFPSKTLSGDESLNNSSKFVIQNNSVAISSSNLKNLEGNNFFTNLKGTQSIYDFESIDNKVAYKLVNGIRTPVYKYNFNGEIIAQSDTYDSDLQAILTAYLTAYKNKMDPNNKYINIASFAIAENNTGNIKVLSSYPNYTNQVIESIQIQKEFGSESQLKLLGYFDVKNQPKNFGLANAMPGSTIKPIYTFSALLAESTIKNNKELFPQGIPEFIRWSNSRSAKYMLAYIHKNTDFQDNLYKYFGFKVFDSLQFNKNNYYPFAPSGNYVLDKVSYNEEIVQRKKDVNLKRLATSNLISSNAWGQGNIRVSLAGLVQDYQRIINRNSQHTLSFYDRPSYTTTPEIGKENFEPLYKGMELAVSGGTARIIGDKLKALGFKDLSNYKGKTGTVQMNKKLKKNVKLFGYTATELDKVNTHSYFVMVTPNYTIGVSTMGVLPNSQNNYHAKGVLINALDFLYKWRNAKYLK